MSRLQGVQNFAARVLSHKKFDHITRILQELSWFSVESNLYFRDALLTFKCMNNCACDYLIVQGNFKTGGEVVGREQDTSNNQELKNISLESYISLSEISIVKTSKQN